MRNTLILALCFVLSHPAVYAQFPILPGVLNATSPSGPAAPVFLSAIPAGAIASVGTTFTFPPFVVSGTGNAIALFVGVRVQTFCVAPQIASMTGNSGGDTFSMLAVGSGTFDCGSLWIAYNVTPSAAYTIVITVSPGGSGSFLYAGGVFSTGSLALTTDDTCNNYVAGGTTLNCSADLMPTGSKELGIGGMFAYDNTTLALPGGSLWTIPVNGTFGTVSGSVAFAYTIGNPPTSPTPFGFTNTGAGDGGSIAGAMIK